MKTLRPAAAPMPSSWLPILSLALLAWCMTGARAVGEVVLARDGKPLATIVLPEETELDRYVAPTPETIDAVAHERFPGADEALLAEVREKVLPHRQAEAKRVGDEEELALAELLAYVEKLSGARLPVKRLAKGEKLPEGPLVLLGSELAAAAGYADALASLHKDGILLKTKGDRLILAGRRARGTLYAVYDFLETLGCRWIMPSPFGELLPSLATLSTDVDKQENPSHGQRYWWCTSGYNKELYGPWTLRNKGNFIKALDDQTVAQGHHLSGALRWGAQKTDRAITIRREVRDWERDEKNRPVKDENGKRIPKMVEKDVRELPEEFYAMSNGKARHSTPNMSNPKVWDLYAEYYLDLFRNRPFVDYASISAEDGLVLDERPESRALDGNEFDSFVGAKTATDRLWFFHNRFIEKVVKVMPNRKFGVLVYSNNMTPPRLSRVHPNMALVFAPLTICPVHHIRDPKCKTNRGYCKWVQAWLAQAEAVGAETYNYDYLPMGFQWNSAMICPQWAIIGKNYPWLHSLGLDGHTTQGFDDWGSGGLANWVAIRLYWNVNQDYHDIIADYCRVRFGPAADAMVAYYGILEKRMEEIPDLCSNEIWGNHLILTPDVRAACRRALEEAEKRLETDRERAQFNAVADMQRSTDFFCDGIEHARETGDFGAAAKIIEGFFDIRDKLNAIYSQFMHPLRTERDQMTRFRPGGWYNKYLTWDRKINGAAAHLVLPRTWKLALDSGNTAWAKGWHRPDVSVAELEDGDTTVVPDVKFQTQREPAAFFYRTDIDVPDTFAKREKIVLFFPSLIARAVQIWINGEPVEFDHDTYRDATWRGPTYFWYSYNHEVEFDVTPHIRPGERNTVAFRVFKSFDHGGPYDRIFLLADPAPETD